MAAARCLTRTVLAGAASGAGGYLACAVAAILEGRQVLHGAAVGDGETVMSRIVPHPADRWVTAAIVILFMSVGVVAGKPPCDGGARRLRLRNSL